MTLMSGLTVIEVICKFFVDRKVNQPNECDSDKKPGRKGKDPIFTEISIIKIYHRSSYLVFLVIVTLFLLPRQKVVNIIIVYP